MVDALAVLIDDLRADTALVDVQIEPGFPGDAVKAEAVYAGEVESEVTYPTYNDHGRRNRFETMSIPLEVRIASSRSLDAVRGRLAEIIEAIESHVADDSTFDDEPLVLDHGIGEKTSFCIGTPEGYLGMALLTVTVKLSIP